MTGLARPAPPARIERVTTPQARYLGRVESTVSELLAASRDADGALAAGLVQARLASLRRAIAKSPFYRDALASRGLAPDDLQALSDLSDFPSLDRACLADRWQDMPGIDDGDPEARRMVAVKSSGSTGAPVTIVNDGFDAVYMWAALRFWCAWYRVALPPRPRAVMLCTLPSGLEYSVRLPLLLRGALHRISTLRTDAAERVRRVRPSVLLTDPEGLHWLAGLTSPPRPSLLLSSAQHLAASERARASEAIGAPVVTYYSTTETTQVAWECELRSGRFHVLVPDYHVESVDGELLVTRFRESLVPLLRYRTGDRGTVERDACACGYHGWTIVGLQGRRACLFVRPDGTTADAWQLAWVFKHTPLRDFRLAQRAKDRFEAELVGAKATTKELAALRGRLVEALHNMGWRSVRVDIRRVPAVRVTANKPEPFDSRVGDGGG